ncbi:MAG TPA: glycosyltransferase family 39 protein [Gaiellaceae bacterium]|nr:glycosyltransferase family 39 protein [Gaiellaceae bacterium]
MTRALRAAAPAVALPALVGISTLLHWLEARRVHGLWIVPDEAIYGLRAVAVWRHGPLALLHGAGAGYGVLYPVVAGVPLAVGSTVQGYASLKLLQALVVSLAAVPVYAYGRRVVPRPYALAAAALTLASPLLLYSGLVMTEVLFYPLAALTLTAVARAVATGSARDQALALALVAASILTRAQAVAFLPVFALAAALDALLAREAARLLRFRLVLTLLAAALAVVVALPRLVGGYAVTLRGSYPLVAGLRLTYDHLALVALATGAAPLAALVSLTVDAARGHERDPLVRSLLSVTIAALTVLVTQVGFFAARYSPHLLGRDLSPLPPLLFLTAACWAARGTKRLTQTTLAAFAVLAVILAAPWDRLVAPEAFADTLDLVVFAHLHTSPVTIAMSFALAVLTAFVAAARRSPLAPFALVFAALVASTAVAAGDVAGAAAAATSAQVGPQPNWIDRAARGGVAYVYGGEQLWSEPWLERFWNRKVTSVVALEPSSVPGPLAQTHVVVGPRGLLPIRQPYAVAPDRMTLVGERVAHLPLTNTDVTGLTLWRLAPPARLAAITAGVQPNGDMHGTATISVYGCRRGELQLTVLPKETRTLVVELDGRVVLRRSIAGLPSWTGGVAVPPSRRPRICTFGIVPHGLLGSTRIAFVPDS